MIRYHWILDRRFSQMRQEGGHTENVVNSGQRVMYLREFLIYGMMESPHICQGYSCDHLWEVCGSLRRGVGQRSCNRTPIRDQWHNIIKISTYNAMSFRRCHDPIRDQLVGIFRLLVRGINVHDWNLMVSYRKNSFHFPPSIIRLYPLHLTG